MDENNRLGRGATEHVKRYVRDRARIWDVLLATTIITNEKS